jgi:hypothetical protein
MRRPCAWVALLAAIALAAACDGSTGSEIVSFEAYAKGPEGARGPGYTFQNGRGYTVVLDRMRLRIGGLYLNRSLPVSGGQERSCFLPGVYVAEVPSELLLDVLDERPQKFPGLGHGTRDRGIAGEVWLTGARIDAPTDASVILDVAGKATRGTTVFPFEGQLTISANRRPQVVDATRPGADPLCSKRIVTPIAVDVTPEEGGALTVQVDPKGMFANVEFSELQAPEATGRPYRFADTDVGQPNVALFAGMRAAAGVYQFNFNASAIP